jgi:D-sedoheptulose 7-phosphate isomerase
MSSPSDKANGNGKFCKSAEISSLADYFSGLSAVLKNLPFGVLQRIVRQLIAAYDEDRAVYVFGNGGSAALASHMACDLGKGTAADGARRFRVISLTDNVPLLTAWANDTAYEEVFAEQLKNLARPKDVAFAISGSGNSPNVLKGLAFARSLGCFNIGLSGFQGGKMKAFCDLCFIVPSHSMQFIEDMHLSVSHAVFTAVRHHIRDRSRTRTEAAIGIPAGTTSL